MTNGLENTTLGYENVNFAEIVEKELKAPDSLQNDEKILLHENPQLWRAELVNLKKRTEFQLTSSSARQFTLYKDRHTNKLTETDYIGKLQVEKSWRCNATRFLQQVEMKITYTKTIQHD